MVMTIITIIIMIIQAKIKVSLSQRTAAKVMSHVCNCN